MHRHARTAVAAALLGLAATTAATAAPLKFQPLWSYDHTLTGIAGQTSEIVSFDALSGSLWVVGLQGVDVLDARTGQLIQHLDTSAFGEANSVAIHNGVAAVAVAASDKTQPGSVRFYDTLSRGFTGSVGVGALPDMLTFTPDGSRLLVANEGESSDTVDPRGSVSVIDMGTRSVAATAGFGNGISYRGSHLRVFTGLKGGTAQDFEPEYIAVDPSGTRAFVVLQEANAVATLDLATNRITTVTGLGVKDFSQARNHIDPNDRDSGIALRSADLSGFYQPDGMAAYSVGGQTFLVMANEGDSRPDGQDEARASDLGVTGDLARATVTTLESTADDLYVFGARSFSIRDADGNLVFDSGNELDAKAIELGLYDDGRSDNKGVEPEGVALGTLGGRTYAFIGLERTLKSAIAVYDVTDPANASFVDMIVSEDDLSPEGLATFTLDGVLYLAVANEVSGTTSVFGVAAVPEPGTWALMAAGLLGMLRVARRRAA